MSSELIIRAEAEAEMLAAFDWYEGRVPGLGADFLLALDAALQRIARHPLQFPLIHSDVRRIILRRFPYVILFITEPRRVVVLAVFHARRNPKHWQDRA